MLRACVFFMVCMSLVGCTIVDISSSNTSPKYVTYSGYYSAGWTLDGKIIASKQAYKDGGADYSRLGVHSIIEIDLASPSSDVEIIRESVEDNGKSVGVWYEEGAMSGFSESGERHLFLEQSNKNVYEDPAVLSFYINTVLSKKEALLPFNDPYPRGINSSIHIWVNAKKDKVMYSRGNQQFDIYSVAGEKIQSIILGGHAIWKNDDTVLFYHKAEGKLAEYAMSTGQVKLYSLPFRPEWYDMSENAVYQIQEGYLRRFDLETSTITYVKKLNYDYEELAESTFSEDGKFLLLTNKRQRFGFYFQEKGLSIYTYNLETDVLTKIRD